jgi:hypothetical protein
MPRPLPRNDRGGLVADIFQIVGFGLTMTGLGLLSIPLALITAGVTLFVVGGLAARRT